jgi:hypothetical protein
MPTPFTHLAIGSELLACAGLPREARAALKAELPAFLLGNIAPDVQTISGQEREATHFFPVPLEGAPPAGSVMLGEYPALARRTSLPVAQAAFVAGYLAHLVFDQLWVARIFEPVFGPQQPWGSFRDRLYLHNVLRAHWDAQDLARLPAGTGPTLRQAAPAGWLPFVGDPHLAGWRDLVGGQLEGGGARTVEVFAERMGADAVELARVLASPADLQQRVFSRLPPAALDEYRAEGLVKSADAIGAYWQEG